ncbi:hypothetical protein PFISCL1PPCAC_10853, partial [Pristionchus fissidentatus]
VDTNKTHSKAIVEQFACTQKSELRAIFDTIFDRQSSSRNKKDLHIRISFETAKMEESSTSATPITVEKSIGGTAGVTPLPRSPMMSPPMEGNTRSPPVVRIGPGVFVNR